MAALKIGTWIAVLSVSYIPASCIFLVVPDDVPAGFATIYGFSPRLLKGNDHRIGFGFGLGNAADFQVMYEFGPQMYTKPIQPIRVRSATATFRQRFVRRRPLLELLLNLGVIKEVSYRVDVLQDQDDEPR